jgi:hypothetical protein
MTRSYPASRISCFHPGKKSSSFTAVFGMVTIAKLLDFRLPTSSIGAANRVEILPEIGEVLKKQTGLGGRR